MKELLELLGFILLIALLGALLGYESAVEFLEKTWDAFLHGISQVGDAWREH